MTGLFKKMTNKGKRPLWITLSSVFSALTVGGIVATSIAIAYEPVVNLFFHTESTKVVGDDTDSQYFKFDQTEFEKDSELCEEVEGQGAVLLLNRDNALPLSKGSKVTALGKSSYDLVTGGTGSGAVSVSGKHTLKSALQESGFKVNDTMWDFYANGNGSQYKRVNVYGNGLNNDIYYNKTGKVNEVPLSAYSDKEWSSLSQYGDAAVIVLGRQTGEGGDIPFCGAGDGSGNMLELTKEEQDLFVKVSQMKKNGDVKKIIVLLNSDYQMELDFLEPEICGTDYSIDACLWIGGTGESGINAVADILSGNVNPSGKLVNTYCYDNLTSPAIQNSHVTAYTNGEEKGLAYSGPYNLYYELYQEGIYVGYRYYETRYEDVVLSNAKAGNYDYAKTVAYPFGYGLSYSTFEYQNYQMKESQDGKSLVFTLDVKNTSDKDGKDTICIYMQSPYTDYDKENHIEKSSVELVGFTKVDVVAGKTVTAQINVDKKELASYDAYNKGSYVIDEGNYYFALGNGAHEALNNILLRKQSDSDTSLGNVDASKMVGSGDKELALSYKVDSSSSLPDVTKSETGADIVNQFDHADWNRYDDDHSDDVTYVTRSDWEGSMPKAHIDVTKDIVPGGSVDSGYLASAQLAVTDGMVKDLQVNFTPTTDGSMPTMGKDNSLKLIQFKGVSLDSGIVVDGTTYTWDDLLDQLTFNEMAKLIGTAYHSTAAVVSVAKNVTYDENGPQGITGAIYGGASATCWPTSDIRAATFNPELSKRMGSAFGNDCISNKEKVYSGIYGPGCNTQRTPYGGRNFEYYSEDPFVAGEICAAEVSGIQSKGVYVYLKHFALNDQETGRDGICVWANEQSIREIYLTPFQKAITQGGAHCVMTSFNRIGCTWSGGDKNLLTNVLRKEWGMDGMAITDYAGNKYMDVRVGLLAGNDIWDFSGNNWQELLKSTCKNDPAIVSAMRQASKRVLYTIVNSNAMNGIGEKGKVIHVTPWWKATLIILDIVFGALALISLIFLVMTIVRSSKAKKE